MFSIVIPTYNNLGYIKLCIESIEKNSFYNHEIIVHINDGSDGTFEFIKEKKIKFSHSKTNIGLCTAMNNAAKLISTNYLLYTHDDMYFCPNWDKYLMEEVNKIGHENFYLCGTMIQPTGSHISLNCGNTIDNFDEKKLLDNYANYNYYDHQGSHFAPHLVTKKIWKLVGGFSEEYNPGIASDPDFNMKLWSNGIRIFKGLNKFKVYHFGSLTTRKRINFVKNKGHVTFIKKWGMSIKFFKKYYLKTNTKYLGELTEPNKSIIFYIELLMDKMNYFFIKYLQNK